MGFFRKKMPIEAAMRTVLGAVLRKDLDAAFADAEKTGQVSPTDIRAMKAELPSYDVAIWHLLFLEYASRTLDAEELSRRFTIALGFALRDAQMPIPQAEQQLEHLVGHGLSYLEQLASVPAGDVEKNGPYFYYCQEFARRIVEDGVVRNPTNSDRRFEVFNIGKQAYQATQELFRQLTKEYRLLTS